MSVVLHLQFYRILTTITRLSTKRLRWTAITMLLVNLSGYVFSVCCHLCVENGDRILAYRLHGTATLPDVEKSRVLMDRADEAEKSQPRQADHNFSWTKPGNQIYTLKVKISALKSRMTTCEMSPINLFEL